MRPRNLVIATAAGTLTAIALIAAAPAFARGGPDDAQRDPLRIFRQSEAERLAPVPPFRPRAVSRRISAPYRAPLPAPRVPAPADQRTPPR